MFPWGLSCMSVLGAAGTALLGAGLLLSLAQHLWTLRWTLSRDRASALPLPKGSMGWPFFGETLHWLVQGSRFHSSRRERYGTVFKTHLLGRPVIRVSGAENVRTILLGEHRLVRSQWPQSAHILLGSHTLLGAVGEPHRQRRKVLARVFSRGALQRFVPRLQGALRREVRAWCAARRPVAVYQAAKALTFRMAARILLGLRLDEVQCAELARTFEQFVENLFSLPLDVPFSGLRKKCDSRGIKNSEQAHIPPVYTFSLSSSPHIRSLRTRIFVFPRRSTTRSRRGVAGPLEVFRTHWRVNEYTFQPKGFSERGEASGMPEDHSLCKAGRGGVVASAGQDGHPSWPPDEEHSLSHLTGESPPGPDWSQGSSIQAERPLIVEAVLAFPPENILSGGLAPAQPSGPV
ncbi:cytochrome P450 26C1 [Leptonychotes weddellii]|uniref:Cytochrome P450 26C1 n=1 Tax=Leptonychotes weddellii TaxID=9713 RepID=A0A7F8QUU5_LEPWE|nr:cytochrome P450 26C1 [Leptonychotes weddellii]